MDEKALQDIIGVFLREKKLKINETELIQKFWAITGRSFKAIDIRQFIASSSGALFRLDKNPDETYSIRIDPQVLPHRHVVTLTHIDRV
jgi:hypothetical protein